MDRITHGQISSFLQVLLQFPEGLPAIVEISSVIAVEHGRSLVPRHLIILFQLFHPKGDMGQFPESILRSFAERCGSGAEDREFIRLIAGNQGEVEKGRAYLKSVEIFGMREVFGRLVSS